MYKSCGLNYRIYNVQMKSLFVTLVAVSCVLCLPATTPISNEARAPGGLPFLGGLNMAGYDFSVVS